MSRAATDLAVLVGIDHYGPELPSLSTPVADARALGEVLERRYSYEVWMHTDRQATRDSLRHLLHWQLPAHVDEDSRLLFYFAGHGATRSAEDGSLDGFLVPQDASDDLETFLPMTELYQALERLPCHHLLVILDCCFAGAFRWAAYRDLQFSPQPPMLERYTRFLHNPARQVITSTAHDERALDRPWEEDGETEGEPRHSPFGASLLSGLQGRADLVPHPSGDSAITASELYSYLLNSVDAPQTPSTFPLPAHGAGEFLFMAPPPSSATVAPPAEAGPFRGLDPEAPAPKTLGGRAQELAHRAGRQTFTAVILPDETPSDHRILLPLVPHLSATGDGRWTVLPSITPCSDPVDALRQRLSGIDLELRPGAGGLTRAVWSWLDRYPARRLALIIDRLDALELRAGAAAQQLQELLCDTLERVPGRFHLLVTTTGAGEEPLASGQLAPWWADGRWSAVDRPA